ncbi:MAG: hypothetical protein RBG13Loki_4141 [Promethearchaeota archaeon CR_4]|nr:MAG: hypothetical protein RBG13Loki_4141 [Candidatus Lokiarchaeota archaeon CR_4]
MLVPLPVSSNTFRLTILLWGATPVYTGVPTDSPANVYADSCVILHAYCLEIA